MIFRSSTLSFAAVGLLLCPFASATVRTHRHTSAHAIVGRSTSTRSAHASRIIEHATYSGISSERATEIQSALIQRGYLTGEPTGAWDASSIAAMQKLQSDNGWQTKFVPDSRALNKIGLGANSASASAVAAAPATSASAQTPQPTQSF